MAARKSRTFVPNAYPRPDIIKRPRPGVELQPVSTAKAKIVCMSTPSGAAVRLTAETFRYASELGVTPVTTTEREGVYTLTFTKEGYEPLKKSVMLKPGDTRTINVILSPSSPDIIPTPPTPPPPPSEPTSAKLICNTTPSGAEVTVEAAGISSYLGGTTPVTLKLEPDVMYTLTFKKPGLKSTYKRYSLKPGEVRTINVTLPLPYAPVPPPTPPPTPPPEPPIVPEPPSPPTPPPEPTPPPDIEPVPPPEPEPPIEPIPPVPPPPPPPEEPEIQKIDVISFTTAPSCVIGDICKGEMVLQNNTDNVLEGTINITMEGAVPVVPVTYAIPAHSKEKVTFEIPTVGLTITGAYTLELDMLMNEEVVESQRSRVDILPVDEYEITITSEPSSAEVVVTEL